MNIPEGLGANQRFREWISVNWNLITQEIMNDFVRVINSYKKQYEIGRLANTIQTLDSFYELIDKLDRDFYKEQPYKMTCKKGCSFCCHMNVDISEDEAAYIIAYCMNNGIKIDWDYLKKQKPQTGKIGDGTSCVFLKNNECSIYPARPINCRKFAVLSPASQCEKASKTDLGAQVVFAFNLSLELAVCGIENVNMRWGRMAEMLLVYSK